MKRKLIAFSMTMALLLSVLSAASVGAFTATIEHPNQTASRSEWDFAKQSDGSGIGIVQRNASQQGAFIFNDAGKDQRIITATDPVTKEADLDWFGVTADASGVYFVAKVDQYSGISNNPSLELIITIDTTQNGAGILDLPLQPSPTDPYSTTQVKNDAAWEFAVRTTFPSGAQGSKVVNGTTRIHTSATGNGSTCGTATCPSQLASAAIFQGSFAEIKVPWGQIGGTPTGAKFLRLTVSTLYDNHTVPADGYDSPVIDVLGINSGGNATLADLQDGAIDTSFDVHFDTNGASPTYEPYAPLLVTEFQPNPIGTDTPGTGQYHTDQTEWIEVYNPNSFPITLSDYKVGNTPRRGSTTQGMLKFNTSSIAAGAVVIVAKDKARFLAGHPGYPTPSLVYELGGGMSQYGAWASGDLQLDNGPNAPATTFEEQVLLLDAKDGIVDMATYGNQTPPYPGHTPITLASVPEGVSYERCPATRDTNDSAVDFAAHGTPGEQTPGVASPGCPGLDLTIAKTGPTNPIKDEATGTRYANFTITYSNIGTTSENAQITVVDTLPAGLTFVNLPGNANPPPASVNGQTLTWTFPNLPAQASGTIVLTATVDSSVGENVPLTNSATINGPSELTAAKNNNLASATVTTPGPADLSISSNFSGPIPAGLQFTYTIVYQNLGQDDAANVTITDTLPSGVTILSVESASATWDGATTGTVTWDVGTFAPTQGGTIVVTAQLASGAQGGDPLKDVVSITVPTNDPTPQNNSEETNTTVGLRKLLVPLILR